MLEVSIQSFLYTEVSSWSYFKIVWQRWDSNPRPFGLVPKTSALDHSATLPFLRIAKEVVDAINLVFTEFSQLSQSCWQRTKTLINPRVWQKSPLSSVHWNFLSFITLKSLTQMGREWYMIIIRSKQSSGSTEIWTRIAGFRVLSDNHYTMEPVLLWSRLKSFGPSNLWNEIERI